MNKEIIAILEDEERLRSMSQTVFEELDVQQDGFINKTELQRGMTRFSKTMHMSPPTEEQVEKVYKEIDENGDGKISSDEFVKLVRETLAQISHWKKPLKPVVDDAEEQKRRVEAQRDASRFREYVEASGLRKAFQIIFAEVVVKKVEPEHVFAYSAMRLRQLGQEIAPLLPEDIRGIHRTEDSAE